MAYNLFAEASTKHLKNGRTVTVELKIKKEAYAGEVYQFQLTGDYFTHEYTKISPRLVFEKPIQKAILTENILIETQADFNKVAEIFGAEEDQFILEKYVNGSLEWTGSVLPDLLEYPKDDYPFTLDLVAKDLTRLEGKDFPLSDGTPKLITFIAEQLTQLGYSIPIHTYTYWENNATDTGDYLDYTYVQEDHLREYRSGDTQDKTINRLEALKRVCKVHGILIRQAGGVWQVIQVAALQNSNITRYEYDSAGIATGSTSVNLDVDVDREDLHFLPTGTVKRLAGLKKIDLTFNHKTLATALDFNNSYEHNLISDQSTVSLNITTDGNQRLKLSGNVQIETDADPADFETGEAIITAILDGSNAYDDDAESWTLGDGEIEISAIGSGGYLTGELTITTAPLPSGLDNVDLVITFKWANVSTSNVQKVTFTDFKGQIINDDQVKDSASIDYTYEQTGEYSAIIDFGEVLYGDGPTNYSKSALQVVSTNLVNTFAWNRAGVSESVSIFEMLLRDMMSLQRKDRILERAQLWGEYDAIGIPVEDSVRYFFLGGVQVGNGLTWSADFLELDYVTAGDDTLTEVAEPGDGVSNSTTGTSSGGPSTGDEYVSLTNAQSPTAVHTWVNGANFAGRIQAQSYIDLQDISPPTPPGSNTVRLYAQSNNGFDVLHYTNTSGVDFEMGRDNSHVARNETGSTITAGTPVYITGSNGNVPTVAPANATTPSTIPVFGVAIEDIANNNFGQIMTEGDVAGLDLTAYAEGAKLYVAPGGGLTTTEPTGDDVVQVLGTVIKNTAAGILEVERGPVFNFNKPNLNAHFAQLTVNSQLVFNPGQEQNVGQDQAPVFTAVNTGQGNNELYPMDQAVLTTSTPEFNGADLSGRLDLGAALEQARIYNNGFSGDYFHIDYNGTTFELTREDVTTPDTQVVISINASTGAVNFPVNATINNNSILTSTSIGNSVQAYDDDLEAIRLLTHSDGRFIVSDGATWVTESGNTARSSLGLGTGDSPTFTNINLTNAPTFAGADISERLDLGAALEQLRIYNNGFTGDYFHVDYNGTTFEITREDVSSGTPTQVAISIDFATGAVNFPVDATINSNSILTSTSIGNSVQAFDQDLEDIRLLTHADGRFIVSNGTEWVTESGNTARTSLGLGTGDNVEFNNVRVYGTAAGVITLNGSLGNDSIVYFKENDVFKAALNWDSSISRIRLYEYVNNVDVFQYIPSSGNLDILPAGSGALYLNNVKLFNTGQEQNVGQDAAVTFATVNTGQGANELYPMDQAVLTTSTPTFSNITVTNAPTFNGADIDGRLDLGGAVTQLHIYNNGFTGDYFHLDYDGITLDLVREDVSVPDTQVAISVDFATGAVDFPVDATINSTAILTSNSIGSSVQAFDQDLEDIRVLTHSDGRFIVSNGTSWVTESGNTARTSLGLGTGNTPSFAGATLTGNLVPGTTNAYDLGTTTEEWRDVYAVEFYMNGGLVATRTWVTTNVDSYAGFYLAATDTDGVGNGTFIDENEVVRFESSADMSVTRSGNSITIDYTGSGGATNLSWDSANNLMSSSTGTNANINEFGSQLDITAGLYLANSLEQLRIYNNGVSGDYFHLDYNGTTLEFTREDVTTPATQVIYSISNSTGALDFKVQPTLNGTDLVTTSYLSSNYYNQTAIENFFDGTTAITGYNKGNWDTAYGWGDHATQNYAVTTGDTFTGILGVTRDNVSIELSHSTLSNGTPAGRIDFKSSNTHMARITGYRIFSNRGEVRIGVNDDGTFNENVLTVYYAGITVEGSVGFTADDTYSVGSSTNRINTLHTVRIHSDIIREADGTNVFQFTSTTRNLYATDGTVNLSIPTSGVNVFGDLDVSGKIISGGSVEIPKDTGGQIVDSSGVRHYQHGTVYTTLYVPAGGSHIDLYSEDQSNYILRLESDLTANFGGNVDLTAGSWNTGRANNATALEIFRTGAGSSAFAAGILLATDFDTTNGVGTGSIIYGGDEGFSVRYWNGASNTEHFKVSDIGEGIFYEPANAPVGSAVLVTSPAGNAGLIFFAGSGSGTLTGERWDVETTSGVFKISNNSSGNGWTMGTNGVITCNNVHKAPDHQDSSDIRIKSKILDEDPLYYANLARLYSYEKEGLESRQVGLIAQDFVRNAPELVGQMDHTQYGKIYTLSGYSLASVALAGVNKVNSKVDKLDRRVKTLEEKTVAELQDQVERLEQEIKELRAA